MVIMDNCHHYGNSNLETIVNSTTEENQEFVYCNWQPHPIMRDLIDNTTTDHCSISAALCVAERAGFAIAIPAICCIGILLNILNLIILSTNRFPESSYTYLTALAVADLVSLFFFAINGIGRGYYRNNLAWRAFEVYAYFPLGSSSTTASIFLTLTVTIERYAFIYHPMKSKAWCHQAMARKVVVIVVLISVALNIPRFFAMSVGESGQLEFTQFGRSRYYSCIVWIYFGLISVSSCVCLIVFNTLLIIGIHRTHRKRKALIGSTKNGSKNQEEATLTRTLIMVVCVFVAGELPSSFTSRSLVVALIGQGNHDLLLAPTYRIAVLISTGLVVTQHSLNFVVYCVFNRRFCAALKHQFLFLCRKENLPDHSPNPDVNPAEKNFNNGPTSLEPGHTEV